MSLLLVAAALVSPATPAPQDHTAPPVFAHLGWDEARAAAREGERFLLLDAMTSWCGPCKVMDKTTWVDESVVAWLGEHAVAVQLDMDLNEGLKDQLEIRAFPTMVLFRADGTEFDRIVGLRKPADMLRWLEGARGGSTELQRLLGRVAEVTSDGRPRTADRMGLASECAAIGADAEAAVLVAWLWDRAPADADEAALLVRWRATSGPNLASELLERVPRLRGPLSASRDSREALLAASEVEVARAEWIALNRSLGEQERTFRWAAMAATNEAGTRALRAQSDRVFDPLVDAGMWAVAGAALSDPLRSVRFLGDNLGAYDIAPEDGAAGAAPATGGSIPAIPMGGMAPAEPAAGAKKPKVIPAIPMGGMAPAKPAAGGDKPKAIPAIPLGGMAPAKPAKAKSDPKVIPAIPMGGMAPAKPKQTGAPKGGSGKAIPAIPMGGMAPAKAKTPAVPMIPMGGGPAKAARPAPKSDAEVALEVRGRLTHQLRRNASRRYGALLAANRTAEAEAVAAALLGYVEGPEARAHLVACALRAGRFEARRDVHLLWLDQAARVR